MTLTAPTQLVVLLSALLMLLAVTATFVAVPFASGFAFEIAVFAYVVLLAGNFLEGL